MPQTFSIPCLVYRQRVDVQAPTYAVFTTKAGDLLRWAAIQRRHEIAEGQQRRLSRAKINAIRRFMQQDVRNTIAPAVTVAIRPGAATLAALQPPLGPPLEESVMQLNMQIADHVTEIQKPGIVIDGQHRLLGIEAFNPDSQIAVVALLDAADAETAFQFVVINNKATRVASDLIRTLALDYPAEELSGRLRAARVTLNNRLELVGIIDTDPESPFAGTITFEVVTTGTTTRMVSPSAIESALAVVDDKNIPELKNDDALLDFFMSIWRVIKDQWSQLWVTDSKLMHKVGIVATTSFITDALVYRYDYDGLDVTDSVAIAEATRTVPRYATHRVLAIRLENRDQGCESGPG